MALYKVLKNLATGHGVGEVVDGSVVKTLDALVAAGAREPFQAPAPATVTVFKPLAGVKPLPVGIVIVPPIERTSEPVAPAVPRRRIRKKRSRKTED